MPLGLGDPAPCSAAASDTTEEEGEEEAGDIGARLEREQERFRRLFGVFDSNQDGYLDKWDLERMCRQLGLDEQAVPLILNQLGADQMGQLSCDDFLRAWIELRTEVERLRQPAAAPADRGGDRQPPLAPSDTPLGDCVSWSSGATSGDPSDSLLALLERAGHQPSEERCQLLLAADQVHQAAVAALRSELAVSAARLAQLTEENSQLQKALSRTLREQARGERSAAERYEQRLVELHSVIAELTRKLQHQRAAAIAEEDEDETDSDSDSESAAPSAELPPDSAPDSDSAAPEGQRRRPASPGDCGRDAPHSGLEESLGARQTSVQHATTALEAADPLGAADSADKACQMTEPESEAEPDREPEPEPEHNPEPAANRPHSPAGAARPAVSSAAPPPDGHRTLEREIHSLVKENGRLQERLGQQEAEINRCRIGTEGAAEERDRLRRQVLEYQRLVECASPRSARSGRSGGSAGPAPVVPRVAERVRLRPAAGVTGSHIAALGVESTRVAEHLVQEYQGASAAQEALHAAGGDPERLLLAQLEAERLRARLEHSQSQVDVLTLSLETARAQSEHLAALCGRYESNCVALQLAAETGDQLTEAFDLLVALQDSELALLLASCRAAGLGTAAGRLPAADAETALRVASEQRRSCENVARHALSRLDRRAAAASEDGSQNTSTTSSSSSGVDVDMGRSDETRVRQHIQRLKVERALVCGTTVHLESTCHTPPPPRPLSPAAAQRLDLEHAVLVQELMALREERAELRSRLFLVERERTGLELKLASCAASEQAHRLQLEQLRGGPAAANDREQSSDAGGQSGSEDGGPEAALQTQVRQLSASLDEVTRTAERRQQHADQFIAELKRANGALADALEKTKRKYQAKLKRLEQQMLQIVERHSNQHQQHKSLPERPGLQQHQSPSERLAPPQHQQLHQQPPQPLHQQPHQQQSLPERPAPQQHQSSPDRPSPRQPCSPVGSRLPVMSPAGRPPPAAGRRPSPATPKRTAPPPPPLSLRPPAGPR
ncbi:colorectal mutant cancer protein-like isoform X2 [Amphibalanus amphitrite]|uniref:colorectal mutant cancer protein-like isoform X2 n=1 Tax=Amphibalanus amphitrite TaxID=1232801 RepID=UPI001C91AD13|nr:colorectal mutant cancer protein-like isoform X2 [Amphibalanus amphitrite]